MRSRQFGALAAAAAPRQLQHIDGRTSTTQGGVDTQCENSPGAAGEDRPTSMRDCTAHHDQVVLDASETRRRGVVTARKTDDDENADRGNSDQMAISVRRMQASRFSYPENCRPDAALMAGSEPTTLDFTAGYTNEVDCTWQLTCPAGEVLLFRVTSLGVRAMDSLSVFDGEDMNAPAIAIHIHEVENEFIAATGSIMVRLSKFYFSAVSYDPHGFVGSYRCAPEQTFVWGCTNPASSNFDPASTADDGSCTCSVDLLSTFVLNPSSRALWEGIGWTQGSDPCNDHWGGVACSRDAKVKHIFLGETNHPQPYCDADEEALRMKGFKVNPVCYARESVRPTAAVSHQLHYTLGESLGDLEDLETLALSNTGLSGTLPSSVGRLAKLRYLDLPGSYGTGAGYFRSLSGTMPPSIGQLSLALWNNWGEHSLSGTFPPSFWDNDQMQYLCNWANPPLSGTLPADIGQTMPNLFYFNWHGRDATRGKVCGGDYCRGSLSGTFPHSWLEMKDFTAWYSTHTLLSGTLPSRMGEMDSLWTWDMGSTPFISGTLPQSFGNLKTLASTQRTDTAYTYWVNPTQNSINLQGSGISGTVPPSLGNLSGILSLAMSGPMSGTLPDTFDLTYCRGFYINGWHRLSGSLPDSIGSLGGQSSMGVAHPTVDFFMEDTLLTGALPETICNTNVNSLHLKNSRFSGWASALDECESLTTIDAQNNSFVDVPTSLPEQLKKLVMDGNPIITTPGELGAMLALVPNLHEVDLLFTMVMPWMVYGDVCDPVIVASGNNWNPLGCRGTRLYNREQCKVAAKCELKIHLFNGDDEPLAVGRIVGNLTLGLDSRREPLYDNLDGSLTVTVPASWIPVTGRYELKFYHGNTQFGVHMLMNGASWIPIDKVKENPAYVSGDLTALDVAPRECPAGSHTTADAETGSYCVCKPDFEPDIRSNNTESLTCHRTCPHGSVVSGDGSGCSCINGFSWEFDDSADADADGNCARCDRSSVCPGGEGPAATQQSCLAGQQPDAEQMTCEACPLGKMSSAGQVCQACENDQEPTEGLTGCVCQFGFYNRSQLGDVVCGTRRAESVLDEGPQCAACRGDCLFCDGIVTAIKPGYATFKSSEDTTDDKQVTRVFHCPDDVEDGEYDAESTCSGDDRHRSAHFDTGGCMEGHEGALCHVCSDTFARKARSGHCTKCSEISGSSSSVWVYIALIALAVGLWHQQQNRTGPINVSESPLSMSLSSTDDTQRVGRMATAARCSFQPLRILITFAQVTAQLGDVLHVQYPPNVAALLAFMRRFVVNALSLLFNAECAGLGGFHRQWILRVLVLPLTLGALVLGRYAFQRKRGKSVALENAKAAAFYAIFLLYPTICNSSFGAFNCMDMSTLQDGTEGVLVLDYAVDCDSHTHVMFKLMSSAVIAIFGLGVPLMCLITVITLRQSASPGFDAAVQRIATQFDVTDDDAAHLVREVTMDQRYKLLTSAFLPGCFYWEAFDMLRKFTLVGVVSVLGSGSAGQIAVGSMLAFAFSTWQVKAWPYKQSADNYLRTATEIEVFLLTMVAFVFISNDYVENKEEYDSTLDLFLMVSFVVLVPLAFIATIVSKVKTTEHDEREARTAAADGTVSGDLHRAFRAYTMGITSEADRSELRRFIGGWNIQRSNAAFLSHGKTQAGSEARLVKLECVRLLGVANAQIFLDSDNLTDLRTLMTNVAESDVLILFNTKDVLSRPWVLVELHTAIEKQVPIVVLDIQNSYQSDRTAMLAALDDLPAYLQRNNPRAVDALTAVNLDPEPLGALLRDKLGRQEHLKFNPHSSASLIEAEVKALCNEIAAVACPDNARILAATVRGQRSVSWPVTGRKCATLIIFDETEAEAEAQALWLQRSLARTTELGDDRFVTCADVTAQNVVEADTVVLVQTKRVLQQSKSLLLLDAALRGHVPVLPVKLLTTDDAVNYSFGDAQAMLQNLQTHLEPAVLDALAVTELDAATVGHSLAELLPNVISRQLDIDGNVADAQLDDILTSLVEFALKRTDPSDSTANPLCSAATETFAF